MSFVESKTLKFSISGLRGIYGKDITPENIPLFCVAFHQTLLKGPIAIARDTRKTGEAMRCLVTGSLLSLGREVVDIGILPTPTLKAYVHLKRMAGGLMISASHNPAEYNALKFIKKNGYFFDEKDNQKFWSALNSKNPTSNPKVNWSFNHSGNHSGNQVVKNFLFSREAHSGSREAHQEALDLHIEDTLKAIPLPKKVRMRVAIDTLGACGTEIAGAFLKKLEITVFSLYPNLLSSFPRKPEPTEDALRSLSKFVKKNRCDIGFAFDPDADRLALVCPSGKILSEEYTLPLAASQALLHRRGDLIVNLSSSWLNQWVAEQFGKTLYRSKVGEAHVVDLMKKHKSEFGGEGNGGVIDTLVSSRGRDSLSGMAWMIALMHRKNQSLDEIVDSMPKRFMEKTTISSLVQNENFLEGAKEAISKKFPEFKLNTTDGLHFSAKGGIPWLHIRASNTEPIVRVMAEARDKSSLQHLLSFQKF